MIGHIHIQIHDLTPEILEDCYAQLLRCRERCAEQAGGAVVLGAVVSQVPARGDRHGGGREGARREGDFRGCRGAGPGAGDAVVRAAVRPAVVPARRGRGQRGVEPVRRDRSSSRNPGPTGAMKSPSSTSIGSCGKARTAGTKIDSTRLPRSNCDWWHGHSSRSICCSTNATGQPRCVQTREQAK